MFTTSEVTEVKKFYVNDKVVYLHVTHNVLSAQVLLRKLGVIGSFEIVRQAPDEDQDMLDVPGPSFDEVVVESEGCNCVACHLEESKQQTQETLQEFFVDMLGDEDYDYYTLPNGKSAPYGLSGGELAAMQDTEVIYTVSLLQPFGYVSNEKGRFSADMLLVAVERDLVFATREKAVQAYNALFGDLYGEV